jgi:hypothetical protein
MGQSLSTQSKKIRNYLAQGMRPKDIASKMKIPRQRVYNAQYYMRKQEEEELAQLKTIKPKANGAVGLAAVKPKPPTGLGTGITSLAQSTHKVKAATAELRPIKQETMWQRIKRFLSGL